MHLVISLVLFGPLVLQALAAPMHNAQAGPSTAGGTSSGSTHPPAQHPGGSGAPVHQPVTVEHGKVYGVAVKDLTKGPPLHEPLVSPTLPGISNYKERKNHASAIKQDHPFIPMHQLEDGGHHVGFVVTHNPPTVPGLNVPEPHVAASTYGQFADSIRKDKNTGRKVTLQSQLLTTPRHVAVENIHARPNNAPESLDDGKFEQLKKDFPTTR